MCYDCDKAALNQCHGGYSFDCLDCAARAYRHSPKSKREHELDYFIRHSKFSRADILERVEAIK